MEETRALSDLELAVARAFQLRGKSRLNRTEFTFALAYELKWFTPEESKEVLEAALKQGVLKETGDRLVPAFNVKGVVVPPDFKPGKDILEEKSLFDRTLDLLVSAGIDRVAALELIGQKQKEYGGLVTPEAAALIIAREKKLNVEPYIDEAYKEIIQEKK
ncbi:MAG TPA: DUF2240 family protein [Methanocella sp.]|uniref:DUF2240 family protein n=1 Tax=Methanocella sp. TaxID=2052833 RepID=UPI002BD204A8|nr:DUF2240 family protein [Methanocella sp.]HTY90663.1 DUF2240 family protein [Methanocella sp.]